VCIVKLCLRLLAVVAAQAALASGVGAAAHHGAPDGESARYRSWRAAVVTALQNHGDAHSLATAAALLSTGPAPPMQAEGLELAGRAGAIAPEDAAIGWLRLRLCASAANCDVRGAATDMRWLDAENAAAWLPTLGAAYRDRDTTEIDRVLLDMAQNKRFDLYWNRIVVFMFASLKAAENTLPSRLQSSDAARLQLVEAIAGGEIVPPFSALVEICREAAAGTARREPCLKVSRMMQQSDTTIAQMAGLGIERRTLPPESREAHALLERRHALEWRNTTAARFDSPLLPWLRNAHARWRLARMQSLRREDDVAVAILRKQGLPLEPPREKR
jgi:hypothetical protein